MSLFRKNKQQEEQQDELQNPSLLKEAFIFLGELVKVIVISLAIIIPIRYFLIQPFYVKGASMEPNFNDREYLIIDEISYRFRQPERGEVVVFRYPLRPSEFFIKRVIALPGEKVEVKNNQVYIYNEEFPDGFALDEFYIDDTDPFGGYRLTELEENEYFLLGDNRDESLDSRSFGPVDKKFITGKVFFIGWPLNKLGLYSAPEYE